MSMMFKLNDVLICLISWGVASLFKIIVFWGVERRHQEIERWKNLNLKCDIRCNFVTKSSE